VPAIKVLLSTMFSISFSLVSLALSAEEAIQQVNHYRQSVGLLELQLSDALTQSAKQHSRYLSKRDPHSIKSMEDAHGEQKGEQGFTGKTVRDRAATQAYPHKSVSENISLGNVDAKNSVELLMSGIYHRFGFFNFLIDEIGIGISDKVYVYNMGRKDISTLCQDPPKDALASAAHDCLGTKVTAPFWQQLCASIKPIDLFAAPYTQRCKNGTLLKADYMDRICQAPPKEALLRGSGSYYPLCGRKFKIKASWFNDICVNPPKLATYRGDGRYYSICDPIKKVPAYWLKERCDSVSNTDKYTDSGRYTLSCNTAAHKIRVEYMQLLDQRRYTENPRYIAWPANNMKNVDVAFYNEIPDPLPDLEESAYPFSLQFNPDKVQTVTILKVDLAYQTGLNKDALSWLSVKSIRQLTQLTDPNKKLTALQFAWFPLQKLRWGTQYRVTVKAKINGKIEQLQWQFKTKSFLGFLSKSDAVYRRDVVQALYNPYNQCLAV